MASPNNVQWQCLDIEPFDGGASCGDWQVFEDISVRYRPTWELMVSTTPDGLYGVITETYYVEDERAYASWQEREELPPRFVVGCRTEYMVCTDPLDPGGTEVDCWYEYQDPSMSKTHVSEFHALAEAWAAAHQAITDDGSTFEWNGRSQA